MSFKEIDIDTVDVIKAFNQNYSSEKDNLDNWEIFDNLSQSEEDYFDNDSYIDLDDDSYMY